jgi:NTE family protein
MLSRAAKTLCAAALLVVPGCAAPQPRDVPLERDVPALSSGADSSQDESVLRERYDFDAWLQAQHSLPKHAVVISISGGSTRAATLAQSVLQALRQFQWPAEHGRPVQSLADDVIAISAVSGGAMTAGAFVLGRAACKPGDTNAQCDEQSIGLGEHSQFENGILKENLLGHFLIHDAEPWEWQDRAGPWVQFFERAYPTDAAGKPYTFGDLGAKPNAPFLILNSTDVPNDRTFSFVQEQFNYLCADLNPEPVALGVAAAGNFPFLSSDIILQNFRTQGCGHEPVTSAEFLKLSEEMKDPYGDLDRATWARYKLGMGLVSRDNTQDPPVGDNKEADWRDPVRHIAWLHLYDGGIADNLGLWPLVRLLGDGKRLQKMHRLGVEDVTLIVLNARWDWTPQSNHGSASPWMTDLLTDAVFDPLNRTTALTETSAIDRLRQTYRDMCKVQNVCTDTPRDIYPVVLDFDQLTGTPARRQLREEIKNIADNSSLGDEPPDYELANGACLSDACRRCGNEICVIIRAGRYLLAQNPCMKALYDKFQLVYHTQNLDIPTDPSAQPDAQADPTKCPLIELSGPGLGQFKTKLTIEHR